ncbi:type II toxin-antitoxin system RelE/ParE family toxin [Niveispirillum sp. KHB5.9]|uniref:type II toxin-antitoxin system RelE/ParE family toxin n=1 Tax=Niveispirillum sp. KHB5.9 TaxID=3400269 RepID=UPI003A8BAD85
MLWLPTALEEIKAVGRRIAADNPAAARRVVAEIRRTGQTMGERSLGRPGRVNGTFEKLVTSLPYILAYAIHIRKDGVEQITILRVIHDFPKLAIRRVAAAIKTAAIPLNARAPHARPQQPHPPASIHTGPAARPCRPGSLWW